MDNVTELCELSSEINGAQIIFASDDGFGLAENLLKETEPKKPKKKINGYEIMDAWVPRRKRIRVECDFVIIKLAARAEIYFICIDTALLVGNVALHFSVQAGKLSDSHIAQPRRNALGDSANSEHWAFIEQYNSETWPHLIPQQCLSSSISSMNKKYFMITSKGDEYTHVRLNVFPDGGISRLRVYGKVTKPIFVPPVIKMQVDLVSKIYGGNCIAYSSCYNNTHPNNLIKPSESINDEDGWQTARSLIRSTEGFSDNVPDIFKLNKIFGEEWAIFKLGYNSIIQSIILDTSFCVGKGPYVVQVQGITEDINIKDRTNIDNKLWMDIIPYTIVNVGTRQQIAAQDYNKNIAYVKLLIKPDGCVSRFRVLGKFRVLGNF